MSPWLAAGVLAAAAAALAAYWWGTTRTARRLSRDLEAARQEVSRRMEEIYSFQELAFTLSESLQPARLAERLVAYLRRFLKGEGALVALAAEDGASFHVVAADGTLSHLLQTRIGEGSAGRLLDALGHERLELIERGDGAQPVLLDDTTVDCAAVVPLLAQGVAVGALAVSVPATRTFSADDLRLLSTVATHAAIVLSNARFFDLIRAGRDQWETTFNAIGEGIALVDRSGIIRRANRALAGWLGVPASQLAGQPLVAAVFGTAPDIDTLISSAADGAPAAVLSEHAEALNRTFRVSASPMRGPAAEAWVVVRLEDVTEERALESQLIQHEKMAAVGQLVSGVAHELNNPLTSIAGLTEFLQEHGASGPKAREHLRVIHEQAERAGRIVRNLLAFARQDTEDATSVDLNDVVRRTVALVAYEMRLREVEVVTSLTDELPRVHGNRHELQQVVLNLLTNAADAMAANPADRPRRVTVRTASAERAVILTVADSGPGIPEHAIPQIFTPFFTTKAPGQGTGLGLSISFQIVQRHGGQLSVRNRAEGGAEFVVQLAPADSIASEPQADSDSLSDPVSRADVEPRRILLVDDDPGVRRTLGVILTGSGSVEAATDAHDAVQRLDRESYDLIIADPRTAVSAGERFGDHLLRRWPAYRDRTIFVTADVRRETQEWLQQLGCRFFVKPFSVGEIKKAASAVLAAPERR